MLTPEVLFVALTLSGAADETDVCVLCLQVALVKCYSLYL